MGRKALIPLVLGLGIGLLAVKIIVNSIQKAQAGGSARQIVSVVRAKQDIMAFEEITKESVEVVETADSLFAPANERIEKMENAMGRVSAKPIPRNAPVLLSMLAPAGTKPGLLGRIPPGHRAVAVKIDESSSAGYQIQPGAWVDVIVVMDVDASTGGKKETLAEVILQHVQVASIGHDANPDTEASGKQMKPAKSATLFVPETEVPKLHLAGTRGKITLAMRGEDDTVTTNEPTKAYSSEILSSMQSSAIPPPAPAPKTGLAEAHPRHTAMGAEPEPVAVLVFHGTTMSPQPGSIERIWFENARSSKIIDMQGGAPTRAGSSLESKGTGRPRPAPAAPKNNDEANPTDASNDEAIEDPNSDGE